MTTEKVKIRLQGHEKFPLREGWINKGLQIISADGDVFTRKDAPDIFGIGNNMVKSLRYWMKALGLTIDNGSELSNLGKMIKDYDPYLEKDFTLWLLHSNITKNISEATTWFMFFNRCNAIDLDKEQICGILKREISKYVAGQSFSEKSLYSDVDVLLNMYSKTKINADPEDKNVSPFAKLGLVKYTDGKYSKHSPDMRLFSEQVVLYELSCMMSNRDNISIEEVIFGENGLSNLYNLSNLMANELLDRLDAAGYIRVDRTAGLDMIYLVDKLDSDAIIENHYNN